MQTKGNTEGKHKENMKPYTCNTYICKNYVNHIHLHYKYFYSKWSK